MASKIGRREFIAGSARIGIGAVLGGRILSGLADSPQSAFAAAPV